MFKGAEEEEKLPASTPTSPFRVEALKHQAPLLGQMRRAKGRNDQPISSKDQSEDLIPQ